MPQDPPKSVFESTTISERNVDEDPETHHERPDIIIGKPILILEMGSIDCYTVDRSSTPPIQYTMEVGINVTILQQMGNGSLHP